MWPTYLPLYYKALHTLPYVLELQLLDIWDNSYSEGFLPKNVCCAMVFVNPFALACILKFTCATLACRKLLVSLICEAVYSTK